MKTLLQINTCNNVFSTGKIASDIGELAIKDGWDSYIVSSKGDGFAPSENKALLIGSKFSTYIHAFESRLFDNHSLGKSSMNASKQLISIIEKYKPDVLHFHIIHGYYLNLPILFKYLSTKGIPVVWTVHSCWEFTGHCSFFDIAGCNKWKKGCYDCPQLNEYPRSWFIDRSNKNFEEKKKIFTSLKNVTLVPVSKWLGGLIQESFLSKYPIHPIYNGIDVSRYVPSPDSKFIKDKFVNGNEFLAIAVASTWENRKNLKDYIAISKLLPKDMKILLVGLSKEQIAALPDTIMGIERTTNQKELIDLYSAADVVLNLSLEETFGLTTVEGFACGTPSIVYNCTASPELVTPETGFVVEPGDLESVVKNMRTIQINGKETYSLACRRRTEEKFNKDTNFKQYIDLYNEMLKK